VPSKFSTSQENQSARVKDTGNIRCLITAEKKCVVKARADASLALAIHRCHIHGNRSGCYDPVGILPFLYPSKNCLALVRQMGWYTARQND
jgi:hypothetical protein